MLLVTLTHALLPVQIKKSAVKQVNTCVYFIRQSFETAKFLSLMEKPLLLYNGINLQNMCVVMKCAGVLVGLTFP